MTHLPKKIKFYKKIYVKMFMKKICMPPSKMQKPNLKLNIFIVSMVLINIYCFLFAFFKLSAKTNIYIWLGGVCVSIIWAILILLPNITFQKKYKEKEYLCNTCTLNKGVFIHKNPFIDCEIYGKMRIKDINDFCFYYKIKSKN